MAKPDSPEYKQVQEEMRALAQFTDENPNPIFRVDAQGTILYANSASLHLLYSWDCEMGTPLPEAFLPAIQEVIRTGFPKTMELENLGRVYSFSVGPVGQRNFIYLYGQDITERKRLDQLKDDFISAVSHELRIPLTIVKGAISNLQDGVAGALQSKQTKLVAIADRQLTRLIRLINDLLDLARLESGRGRFAPAKTDAAALLQQVVKDFKLEAKKHRLTIQTELSRPTPLVFADPELVHQVLNNLMGNALRFAKTQIGLEAQPAPNEAKVIFRVSNDGEAIPFEEQQRLFSKFYQASLSQGRAVYKGTGLGLTICKEIVERHGGKIGVESQPNQGVTFYFTLPSYDEATFFQTSFHEALIRSQENKHSLSVMGLKIQNLAELKSRCGDKAVGKLFATLQTRVKTQVLRGEDKLFFLPKHDVIVVLAENDKKGGKALCQRILAATQDLSCDNHRKKYLPQIKIELAVYPEDTAQPEELLAQVVGEILP